MARQRRSEPDPSPIDPGGRQRCRFPEWWSDANQMELEAAHRRAAQLVAQGHGSITWEELWGRR
jgi:hypothetical protein